MISLNYWRCKNFIFHVAFNPWFWTRLSCAGCHCL